MVRLTAPNGSVFEASDGSAPKLLAAGWKKAGEPEKPARKRAAKTKEK